MYTQIRTQAQTQTHRIANKVYANNDVNNIIYIHKNPPKERKRNEIFDFAAPFVIYSSHLPIIWYTQRECFKEDVNIHQIIIIIERPDVARMAWIAWMA